MAADHNNDGRSGKTQRQTNGENDTWSYKENLPASLYAKIGPSVFDKLARQIFHPDEWRQWFDYYSRKRDSRAIKAMRVAIMKGTMHAVETGQYMLPDGSVVALPPPEELIAEVKNGVFYGSVTGTQPLTPNPRYNNTVVEVYEGDCIEAALLLKERGLNPAVLNMASEKSPGGGYLSGAGAQEENLHRRTNYFQYLHDPQRVWPDRKWRYPLPKFGGVYSPNVLVFRASEVAGYGFLPEPEWLGFVAVAALRKPELIGRPPHLHLSAADRDVTRKKMRAILRIAYENNHDALVLSAFGCGAFGNPPADIAEMFAEVIIEYDRCFVNITFAIFDDHNAGKKHNPAGNVQPFRETFTQFNKVYQQAAPSQSVPTELGSRE